MSLLGVAALVDHAAELLDGVTRRTPLQRNERLSKLTGAEVWLKREDLQPVRSYKLRGAYTLMSQLSPEARQRGVICASAGNHGQGVAWSCARLGIDGQVFVPTTTPRQKRERIRELGGPNIELVVVGETYDAAAEAAAAQAALSGRVLVPAFDDLRTLTGQGTVAREVVDQLGRAPDVMVVPVGGGGLITGCGAWLSVHSPQTRLVGVEPAGAACLAVGLDAGHPVTLASVDTFVDGAAVRRAGDLTLALARQLGFHEWVGPSESGRWTGADGAAVRDAAVDPYGPAGRPRPTLMSIPEGQVCSEMLALYQTDGVIAEPAGALAPAALRRGPRDTTLRVLPGQTVVVVVSGGNNDISRYSEVLERSLIHEGRKHYFMVSFAQEPGQLRRFLDAILGPDDDIVLFEYVKKSNRETGPALVGIELGDPDDLAGLLARADASPIRVEPIPPDSAFFRYLV
ncbi:MAG: pyridoxal-phosphate dependent enzyme [Propionibacteriaceae bacterium]|jgi:threonine dehydratase|nr:pyridoxal-phosphate dependent enzyme [Propionibacteriaceae bacterium]